MSRSDTIGKHKTSVTHGIGGAVKVKYHNTVVWERSEDGKVITLRTGGWKTVTTKRRMSQAFTQFGYRIVVGQLKGKWYVNNNDGAHWDSIPFDGDTLEVNV